jgi:hypothetical protein
MGKKKKNQIDEKIQEDYWKILQNISEWIRFSDQKSVFVITTYSVILTLIYTNSNDIYAAILNSKILTCSSVLSGLSATISIYYSFLCLSPSLKNVNKSSIFFFGHIANHNSHLEYYEYSKSILQNTSELEENLAEQIYTNSKIATRKFKLVTLSIRAQILSISIILFSLILYFS